ncbi:MAG: efflux transporter outer membrane subunit [Acidobacteriota bacterium]
MRQSLLLLGLTALATSACTVGPNYVEPVAPVPDEFTRAAESQEPAVEEPTLDPALLEWWAALGDDQLTDLVRRAMESNLDVRVALARIEEARAFRRAQGGRLLPTVGSSATGGRQRASGQGPGPLAGLAEAGLAELTNDLYTVGFDAAWELDLFGRVRRAKEASQARLESVEESRRSLLLVVAADVAATYVEWTGASERLRLAERNLELQESTLDTIEVNVSAGLAPPLDLQRSRSQVETVRASLPPLRTQRAAAEHRLAVLLGRPPGGLDLRADAAVPVPPTAIASGLPSDLVWRRPDLRAAERQLHAANADIGAAIGDRFPIVSLGGSRGFEAGSLSDLLEAASRTWTYGPRIDLPIFRGGQLKAAVESARARYEIASANWQNAVLGALDEVETALVGYAESKNQEQAFSRAAEAGQEATELAQILFDEGLTDFLNLLDAQRSQTQTDDGHALARIGRAQRAIALYRALGGGWEALDALATPPEGQTSSADSTSD